MTLKLSDFQSLKDLGSGSFGAVKLMRKKDDKQLWALKTVSLSKLTQKQKDNALNQVRLLASIQIPNVIAYKGSLFHQQSSSLCIFMEYADGGDLQNKLKEIKEEELVLHGLEEKYVWKVAYEILQGLKMLHGNKIVHRDIKSANIFFVNGIAKLGDMNVSKVVEQGMCQTQTGTPYYTAPEIWSGKKYDYKCDIWSLGVLLYEMCCLKMPFVGKDFPSLYRKVCQGKYKEIPEGYYSEPLRNLVRMCLIVEEEMRPSALELLETAILSGMEASLSSFNAEEGQVKLLDPIKCPKVLRFLAVKLPKPREEERKVAFTKTPKKEEQSSFKIKSVKKIRSQKNIRIDDSLHRDKNNGSKIMMSPKGERKVVSRKHITLQTDIPLSMNPTLNHNSKIEKISSKKNIKLPPLDESRSIMPSPVNRDDEKKSLRHIGSSRKILTVSSKNIHFQKEN